MNLNRYFGTYITSRVYIVELNFEYFIDRLHDSPSLFLLSFRATYNKPINEKTMYDQYVLMNHNPWKRPATVDMLKSDMKVFLS